VRLILATRNRHKIREMLAILGELEGVELTLLDAFRGVPELVEDGDTLEKNAILKVSQTAAATGELSLAEDTGLEIDALDGRPGVHSARFAGQGARYEENVVLVLTLMQNVSPERRTARFRSVIAIMAPGGKPVTFEGICPGTIITERRGCQGFGYDPIFIPQGYGQTFAEMGEELKNHISHRARALEKAREYLKNV
jgi:XTP/dITP diphosphohydrolase